MRKALKMISYSRKGFTLIEILVAIAIMGIVIVGLSVSIQQVITVNAASVNHEAVIKQVENAVQYISRDAQQAQSVTTPNGPFPLTLKWTTWGNPTPTIHLVTYAINGGVLTRSETIGAGAAKVTRVADSIDTTPGMTTCSWAAGVFNLKITATAGGFKPITETRTVQITARFAQ
jgi:prepilin-type N-terminal cleavage/methylation domain-containing protein